MKFGAEKPMAATRDAIGSTKPAIAFLALEAAN